MSNKIGIAFLALLLLSCEKTLDSDTIQKYYGDAFEDIGYSVSKGSKGFFIGGQYTEVTRDPQYHDITGTGKKMCVFAIDENGNEIAKELLSKNGKDASALKIITVEDGNVVAAGFIIDPVTSKKDVYIAKVEANGEGFSERVYKISGNQYAADILEISDGYIVLVSTDAASGINVEGKKDVALLKISRNLDSLQYNQKGFPGDDEPKIIKADPGANGWKYMIMGTTDWSPDNGAQADKDIFLLPVNQDLSFNGGISPVGGSQDESAADFEVLSDGYLLVANAGPLSTQSGYVWKMPRNIYAAPVLSHSLVIEQSAQAEPFSVNAICRYKTNLIVMAGQYGSSSPEMLVFATDIDGNFIEGFSKISGGTGTQIAYDVITDNDNIIAVGKNSYENNSMISLLKFRF